MKLVRNVKFMAFGAMMLLGTIACKKETIEDPSVPSTNNFDVTFYTNQTGNPDANGLLALIKSKNSTDEIAIYGSYKSDGYPDKALNVRHYKTDGDTVFNFLLDRQTGRLHTTIMEVNGQRSNVLVKYEYPGPSNHTRISVYDYNWSTETGVLVYSANYVRKGDGVIGMPNYIKSTGGFILSVASAILVVEGVTAVGAGIGALAVSVGVSGVLVATAVVGTFVVAALTSSEASANDSPQTSYPDGVPTESPVEEDETQNTPPNPCLTSDLNVVLGIDPGNELVAIAQGGAGGPYNFYWSSGQTGTANTYHSIFAQQDGIYYVVAVDQLGCAAYNSEYVGNMAVFEKMKQWGPWRTQDTGVIWENPNTGDDEEVPGFIVFTFTNLDCLCTTFSFYRYLDVENDIFTLIETENVCLSVGQNEMNFIWGNSSQCPPSIENFEGQFTVVSVAPLSLKLSDSGFIWDCVPFN
jgi:hypothetical protein